MSPTALKAIKEEVKRYIDNADEKVVKMVHAMLEVAEQDDEYIKELDKRTKEYENGEPVTMTLEELEEGAKNYRKAKKNLKG